MSKSKTKADDSGLSPLHLTLAIVVVVAVALGVWYFNRGYGKTSALGYRYATALFTACNRQDEAKLKQIAEMIAESEQKGELSGEDARVLEGIIGRGEAGNWAAASREIRRLMEAQVERAEPLPDQPSSP